MYENIRPVEHDISVTSDDRVLIQNADRSKRKKMNTPKKSIEMTFSSNKPQAPFCGVLADSHASFIYGKTLEYMTDALESTPAGVYGGGCSLDDFA